jgi:hypothetical protein
MQLLSLGNELPFPEILVNTSIWISSHRTVSLRTTKGRKCRKCRKCLPYRSKNVVQVAAKPRKSERKSEQNGEKQLAPFCYKLSLFSGLRRLRQVLVNLVPRFASRGSPVRSRPRPPVLLGIRAVREGCEARQFRCSLGGIPRGRLARVYCECSPETLRIPSKSFRP